MSVSVTGACETEAAWQAWFDPAEQTVSDTYSINVSSDTDTHRCQTHHTEINVLGGF